MKRMKQGNINTQEHWDNVYLYNSESQDFLISDRRYLEMANFVREEDRVLDIGCGQGGLAWVVKTIRPQSTVTGIDISDKGIEFAKRTYGYCANFLIGKADELPFKDESFDTVLCGEVIEHLEDPEKAIKEMSRVLKKDTGKLLISTPFREYGNTYSQEHVWSFEGQDLKEICEKYFKEAFYFPWASGRLLIRTFNGEVLRKSGDEDILLVLAYK